MMLRLQRGGVVSHGPRVALGRLSSSRLDDYAGNIWVVTWLEAGNLRIRIQPAEPQNMHSASLVGSAPRI